MYLTKLMVNNGNCLLDPMNQSQFAVRNSKKVPDQLLVCGIAEDSEWYQIDPE